MRRDRIKVSAALLLVWLATLAAVAMPGRALAQAKEYHMDRYDAAITVNADGSLDITETLTFVFTSGTFRRGLRTWELDKVEGITVESVAENKDSTLRYYTEGIFDPDDSATGVPGTYGTENNGGELRLRWIYGLTSNTSRTFLLTYHVDGAIRVYGDHDEFDWYAVPPEWASPIDKSHVQVTFPQGSNTSIWPVASVPSNAEVSRQNNMIVWTASSGLDAGFEVGAKIPKGVLSANKPSWQAEVDRQEQQQAQAQNNLDITSLPWTMMGLGTFIMSVLSLLGGIFIRLVLFFVGGK